MLQHIRASLTALLLFTVLTGVLYPLAVTCIAASVFPINATGNLLYRDGTPIGSSLIGQPFDDPKYFWGRPSATTPMPYNAVASSGSNLGPLNPALLDAVKARLEALNRADPDNPAPIPVDKVTALDLGADDYLTKPFGLAELQARLRVALRHAARTGADGAGAPFTVGDLKVDLTARRVFSANREVHLTPIEYRLLTTLVKHAGKVLTHSFLLKEVWGPPYTKETHYLRVFMANLRHKLEANPTRPRYLLTEQGVGYRLADE